MNFNSPNDTRNALDNTVNWSWYYLGDHEWECADRPLSTCGGEKHDYEKYNCCQYIALMWMSRRVNWGMHDVEDCLRIEADFLAFEKSK